MAAVLLVGCQPKPEFTPDLRSHCFNNASTPSRYGVWAGEGTTDWRVVREETWPVLVFGFSRGAANYSLSDLDYCFFLDMTKGDNSGLACTTGNLSLTELSDETLTGSYDFTLADGSRKAESSFSADYCPPSTGPQATANKIWLRILRWLDD